MEKLEMLEKLENEPFSEFGWKSWKTIGFSHALAGKAGVFLSRNRIEEEKIIQYSMKQAFFHQAIPGSEAFAMFCQGWLVELCPLGVVYWKALKLYRKFQFIGYFKVTQCVVTIVRQHFLWLEFHIKIHGMAGKQCAFFSPEG